MVTYQSNPKAPMSINPNNKKTDYSKYQSNPYQSNTPVTSNNVDNNKPKSSDGGRKPFIGVDVVVPDTTNINPQTGQLQTRRASETAISRGRIQAQINARKFSGTVQESQNGVNQNYNVFNRGQVVSSINSEGTGTSYLKKNQKSIVETPYETITSTQSYQTRTGKPKKEEINPFTPGQYATPIADFSPDAEAPRFGQNIKARGQYITQDQKSISNYGIPFVSQSEYATAKASGYSVYPVQSKTGLGAIDEGAYASYIPTYLSSTNKLSRSKGAFLETQKNIGIVTSNFNFQSSTGQVQAKNAYDSLSTGRKFKMNLGEVGLVAGKIGVGYQTLSKELFLNAGVKSANAQGKFTTNRIAYSPGSYAGSITNAPLSKTGTGILIGSIAVGGIAGVKSAKVSYSELRATGLSRSGALDILGGETINALSPMRLRTGIVETRTTTRTVATTNKNPETLRSVEFARTNNVGVSKSQGTQRTLTYTQTDYKVITPKLSGLSVERKSIGAFQGGQVSLLPKNIQLSYEPQGDFGKYRGKGYRKVSVFGDTITQTSPYSLGRTTIKPSTTMQGFDTKGTIRTKIVNNENLIKFSEGLDTTKFYTGKSGRPSVATGYTQYTEYGLRETPISQIRFGQAKSKVKSSRQNIITDRYTETAISKNNLLNTESFGFKGGGKNTPSVATDTTSPQSLQTKQSVSLVKQKVSTSALSPKLVKPKLSGRTSQTTKTFSVTQSAVGIKSALQTRSSQSFSLRPAQSQNQFISPISRTNIRQVIRPAQTTALTPLAITTQTQLTRTGLTIPNIPTSGNRPYVFPGQTIIPGFGIPLPSGGGSSQTSRTLKGGKREKGYIPSFGALIFRQFGTYKKGKLASSGLDFRPITKDFAVSKRGSISLRI